MSPRDEPRRVVLSVLAMLVVLAVGCGRSNQGGGNASGKLPGDPSARLREHLGGKTMAILDGGTRVEVFRIDPVSSHARPDDKIIDEFPIRRVENEQGSEFAASLRAAVFDERAHFGGYAGCFDPGIAFRVWNNTGESVEVLVCFYCSNLVIIAKDANGTVIKRTRSDFASEGARPAFVRLVKQAFPDDGKVQRLTETPNPKLDLLTID